MGDAAGDKIGTGIGGGTKHTVFESVETFAIDGGRAILIGELAVQAILPVNDGACEIDCAVRRAADNSCGVPTEDAIRSTQDSIARIPRIDNMRMAHLPGDEMSETASLTGTLQNQIAMIQTKDEIAGVLHAYARAMRRGLADEATSLFTADATFETRQAWPGSEGLVLSRFEGRDAIGAYLGKTAASVRLCPSISNITVALHGDTATSECLLISYVLGTPHSVIAEYEDTYAFEEGWRFSSRRVNLLVNPAS